MLRFRQFTTASVVVVALLADLEPSSREGDGNRMRQETGTTFKMIELMTMRKKKEIVIWKSHRNVEHSSSIELLSSSCGDI